MVSVNLYIKIFKPLCTFFHYIASVCGRYLGHLPGVLRPFLLLLVHRTRGVNRMTELMGLDKHKISYQLFLQAKQIKLGEN